MPLPERPGVVAGSTPICPHHTDFCGWFPRVSPCLGLAQSQINKYFPREPGCGPQGRWHPILLSREGPEKVSLRLLGFLRPLPRPAQGDAALCVCDSAPGSREACPPSPAPLLWALRLGRGRAFPSPDFLLPLAVTKSRDTCSPLIKGQVSLQLLAE